MAVPITPVLDKPFNGIIKKPFIYNKKQFARRHNIVTLEQNEKNIETIKVVQITEGTKFPGRTVWENYLYTT